MKKRLLAILLAAIMVVSLLPVTALADNASVTIEYKGGTKLDIDGAVSNLESIGLDSDWSFSGSKNGYKEAPYFDTEGALCINGSNSKHPSVTVTALAGQNILSIELSLASGSPVVSANGGRVTGEDYSGKMVYSFGAGCASFTVARDTDNVKITSFTINYSENAPQKELVSLEIQGTPTKTEYTVGESFDPTGLTVQATYSDESNEDVTENAAFTVVPETFTAASESTSVKVTAKVGSVTSEEKTINNIKVKAPAPAPEDIEVTAIDWAYDPDYYDVYVYSEETTYLFELKEALVYGKTYRYADMEPDWTCTLNSVGYADIKATDATLKVTQDEDNLIHVVGTMTLNGAVHTITYDEAPPTPPTTYSVTGTITNAQYYPAHEHFAYVGAVTFNEQNCTIQIGIKNQSGIPTSDDDIDLNYCILYNDSMYVEFAQVATSFVCGQSGLTGSLVDVAGNIYNITLTAAYAITNGTPESDAEKNHGYIAIDKKTAAEGETVTITVNPADGYELKSLTVTPEAKTISTIADVLATVEGGFPEGTGGMKDCPDDAWVNNSDRYTFVVQSGQNSALNFYYSGYVDPSTGTQGSATFVLTTTGVTPGENCYTATSGNNTLTFNMTDGKLTGIVFSSTAENARKRYGGTYTAPAGTTPPSAEPETITPEKQTDGTYTFTMPGYAVTVTAEFASTYSPETRDEHGIITKPADGKHVVYDRLTTNTSLYPSGSTLYLLSQSGRATMVECADGTVYWQNPISTFSSGAWIKGTKEGNTITFPAGQPVIYSKDYNATLSACWGYYDPTATDPKKVWTRADDYQKGSFVFEISGDTLTLQGTSAVKNFNTPFYFPGIFWDDDNSFNGYGDCGVKLTYVPSYTVTNGTPEADATENHGYITVSSEVACEGDFVTVQVWPARNYLLKSLSYQGEGDPEPTTINRSMLGSFQFQMPAKKVTVTAAFEAGPAEFVTADAEHPVYDAADFAYYKKGETTWRGYPFVGWFYEDGGTEVEFTGSFAEAENGMLYTARWKNAAGNFVLTDGITVDANGVYIGEAGIYAATDGMTGKTFIDSLIAPSGDDKLGAQSTVVPKRINSSGSPRDTFAAGADGLGGAAGSAELEKYGIRFTPAQNGAPVTLTLENVSIEAGNGADTYYSYSGGQEIYAGIFSTVPLHLALTGENTVCITRIDAYGCACGIFGGNNVSLTVTGGKLTADASQANGYQTGGVVLNGGALTNSATLEAIGGSGAHSSYGVSCGYLMNTSGALTGRAGSAAYANGLNLNRISEISGGRVVGCGGSGSAEYYGLWSCDPLTVSGGVLEVYGGTKTGTETTEALYLENEYATITISGSGKLVADSTVKNLGKYDGYYTVTGAQTDITGGKGLALTKTGEANIEVSAKEYTVKFNANGGTSDPASVTTMAYVEVPNITRSGYALAGWYKDPAFTQAWDFENNYVRADMALYAKWVADTAVGTVSGTVVDETPAPVDEAFVYLMRGGVTYDAYMTGSDGTFGFSNVPAGEYQLVATKDGYTTTVLVTVASDGTVTGGTDITLYTTSKTCSAVEITGKDTPDIMAGGLAEVAYANKDVSGGNSVSVTLVVESKAAENVNEADKEKIETAAGSGKELDFIDMTLLKKVGAADPTPITDTEGTLLELVIPYDLSGKNNIALYRQHGGEASAVKLPESEANAVDGEYVIIDKANDLIRAFLRYFSTYAIGYEKAKPRFIVEDTASYAVELAANIQNGKVAVSPKNASAGQTVTLTVMPDKGFTLETLTVLDKNGKKVEVKNLGNNKYSFKMPDGKVSVSATFMEDNAMLNFFVDVKAADYFYDAVLWAAENDITNGTDATHFSPNTPVTRAQVVTFLWRAAGCPEAEHTAAVFKDVSPDAYYVKAVEWALSEGITKGTSNTTFSPDAVCTRGQIVTFLARFAGVKDAETASVFTDVNASDYFAAAVKWAKENGVTEGTSATTFSPKQDCTRAQVVTFLYRLAGKLGMAQ